LLVTNVFADYVQIVVTANQASVADNFWLRAIPQSACSGESSTPMLHEMILINVLENDNSDDIRGIIYYGSSPSTPTTSAYDYEDSCDDETANLVPYISKDAEASTSTKSEGVTVGFNSDSLFRWYLNSTTMIVDWQDPTLLQVLNGNATYATSNAVIELPNAGEWVYIVIETTLGVPHPIHLHGHDFFVLAQGSGTYSSDVALTLSNPPRRDTAMLPASGYLVMAFETDNPGAWLMHCHIGKRPHEQCMRLS
jgi:FtsP/CotA-like multicopper oxidase with cupredoxin domain